MCLHSIFFCFKQKTAYEMRISDWSSDVCSSDLEPEKPQSLLSQPQVETMRHVYEQKNSKQIARLMDVSPHTVDERVRKVLKKLNVANRIEAAQFLADNGAFNYAIPQPPLRYQLANLANATPTAEGHHNGARGIFDI